VTDIANQFGAPPVGDTMRRMGEGSPFAEARDTLQLTPEEQALYIRHLQNLWGTGGVDHPDGSRSTLYQMSVGPPGNVQNIPTVWNGVILPPGAAMMAAGQNGPFPSYPTHEAAEDRYGKMHDFMERDTEQYQRRRR
jgi:hypothetical protein